VEPLRRDFELAMQARQFLRCRRARPRRPRVTVAETPSDADERLTRGAYTPAEQQRAHDSHHTRRDQDHTEGPEVVIGQEHRGSPARPPRPPPPPPRAAATPGPRPPQTAAAPRRGAPHPPPRGAAGDRRCPRRKERELDRLVHYGSNR